jgi:VWFA-related protein
VWPAAYPLPTRAGALGGALERLPPARGRTALYSAVEHGLHYVNRGQYDRKVLIVIADGSDNASDVTFDTTLSHIQASNAVVYAVGLTDPLLGGGDRRTLKQFAEVTGGEAYFPNDDSNISVALGRVAADIRHAYVVAFEPSESTRGTGLRSLRVTVKAPDGQRAVVRTRSAYLSAPSTQPEAPDVQ